MDVYQIDKEQQSDGVITLDSELTNEHTPSLDRAIEKLIEGGATCIIINCESLRYISSYGLSWMIKVHKRLSVLTGIKESKVFLVGPQQYVIDTVRAAKLDRILLIVSDKESCISSCK